MPDLQIQQVTDFLDRYKDLRTSHHGDIRKKIEALRNRLSDVNSKRLVMEAAEAPDFNVMRLFRNTTDELSHSRVIADLLSPRGSHGQRGLFLTKFLECFEAQRTLAISERDFWKIRVLPEKVTWSGRIDIVLKLPKSVCIAIENKVNAREGRDQLLRDSDWLERQPERLKLLIFLTPTGRQSEQKITKDRYLTWSYNDIARWLEECLPSAGSHSVRLFLQQYLIVVREISAMIEEDDQDAE
jgi:hypothetical protein